MSKLDLLVKLIPNVKLLYQYDSQINTHIVEVIPSSVYESNFEYRKLESEISYEYDQIFATENLLFVSSESLCRVTKPDKVFTGILYDLIPLEYKSFQLKFEEIGLGYFPTNTQMNFAYAA